MSYNAANCRAREMLRRANESLTAAASCVHRDPEAALDDVLAARLLIGASLLALQQGGNAAPLISENYALVALALCVPL